MKPSFSESLDLKLHTRMASSKNSDQLKPNWDDMTIEDSASDLEESWAGEEVMFDGSPSSGRYVKHTNTLTYVSNKRACLCNIFFIGCT